MKTGNKGLALIKSFESLQLKAYQCPAGVWTIGYGHTKGVKQGDVIDEKQADQFLKEDCIEAEKAVNAQNLTLSQNQFDALVSFVFNVGVGNFQTSTLLKKAKLNAADPTIADEFAKWNKARVKGVLSVLNGLTRRRQAESDLYFS